MTQIALSQLRALVAVVETGGFGAAAGRLGVSQSAVSHAIAALERTAGRPVITRKLPSAPTQLGWKLFEHARLAVVATVAAESVLQSSDHGHAGSITLAAPPTACHGLLPSLLDVWRPEFPRVDVVILEGEDDEVAGWLEDGTADLAVLIDPPSVAPGAEPLAQDSFRAVLRSDHPLALETIVDVADLGDDPLLLSTGGCERYVRDLYRKAQCEFAPAHRVRQIGTIFSMVRAGIGVSLVPDTALGMQGEDVVLVPVRPTVERLLTLSGPAHRPWHPAVGAMIDVVRLSRA